MATIIPLLSHEAGAPKDADHVFSTKTLTRDALVAGTRFFWCRYAFGIAVLQRDIIEKAWQTIDLPLDLDFVRSDRHRIGAMLRRSSGMTITFHDAAKAHASLRSALSAVQVHRDKSVAQIVHLFSTMRSHGLGLDVGAVGAHDSLLFQKSLWCDLSESAAKFLFELRISPTSFGAAISKRSRCFKGAR